MTGKFKVGDDVLVISKYGSDNASAGSYVTEQLMGTGVVGRVMRIDANHYVVRAREDAVANPMYISGDFFYEEDLVAYKEKNMDNLAEGDILVKSDLTFTREVQGVIGKAVVTIDSDDKAAILTTIEELKDDGWELKGEDDGITEVTLSEVAEKLGLDVKKLRIKD